MKTIQIATLGVLACFVSLTNASESFAKGDRLKTSQSQAQMVNTPSSGSKQVGLGLSTSSPGLPSQSFSALSAWMRLNQGQALQLTLGLGATSPKLTLGFAGYYKFTLFAGGNAGFHVGAGAGLGSVVGKFFFSLAPIAGIHFFFPGLDRVLFNLDTGATLSVTDGTANFQAGALSSLLGLSVHYIF